MKIQFEQKTLIPKSEFKEMLTVSRDCNGKTVVRINFSSLDIIQTCMRKAKFSLQGNYSSISEAPALVFGTGVHKALESWYLSPRETRKHGSVTCDDAHAALLAGNSFDQDHEPCARCTAMKAFIDATKVLTDNDGARSPESGVNILNNYFDVYLDDPYEILHDKHGPICERTVATQAYRDEDLEIWFFGTIDSVLQNRETKEIVICDHKTTSSLGKDFFNRIKPNFQYAGYWLLAREALGLKPSQFMVNGIQVAKTKQELSRQFTSISDEEIEELRTSLIWAVRNYLRCESTGIWPMSTPSSCAMWGGCQYKRVCEMPSAIQDSILSAEFVTKGATVG